MNTPNPVPPPDDQMPANFGLKYVFWMVCRWVYFNPLTILLAGQSVLVQIIADYPSVKWLATAASVIGVAIAQVRNRGKDYTVPIAQSKGATK